MANRSHPVDDGLDNLLDFELGMIRHFASDNVFCPVERALIQRLRSTRSGLERYRARQRFGEHLERGQEVTPYTQELGASAGFGITSLEDVRQARKVVAFPARDDDDYA